MSNLARRRATYEDLLEVPDILIAAILDYGESGNFDSLTFLE